MSTVLVIGAGDMGERLAAGLAGHAAVRRLLLTGRSEATVTDAAVTVASGHDCLVEPLVLDAARTDDVASLLASRAPDLVVLCASRRGPWELIDRRDAAAEAVGSAGLALRLPYQLAVPLAVMRAVERTGYSNPVANLSFPDLTGPVLAALGLAPTLGLGNAGMIQLRARAAWRAEHPEAPAPPLIRVIAHHAQVFDVMRARPPARRDERARIYRDESGWRDDDLGYRAPALEPGVRYNHATAAAALAALGALLPGARPLRCSTAAPHGLPGGYPVRIADRTVSLDLPAHVPVADALAFNQRSGRGDGVERIDADGTVHFTAAARTAVAGIAAELADPLRVDALDARAALLDEVLRRPQPQPA
ncbi:hypothetical protein FFT09_02280 [Saccharomonospora piscinae]|uniref:hypothetical protein n=1 Tax=Saccharomonospora piscinae TaxID=687388 RepID=UPI001105F98B|nr:hypothetical protein [Saccharomonospora piscinae]TLW94723.1 hypothetical protein FFT09_02280 [Saccharomonospora piscinae]